MLFKINLLGLLDMNHNYSLRDEIKEYWSLRAPGFDAQPGHGIRDGAEKMAWLAMLDKQLGEPGHRKALDLACGTGANFAFAA